MVSFVLVNACVSKVAPHVDWINATVDGACVRIRDGAVSVSARSPRAAAAARDLVAAAATDGRARFETEYVRLKPPFVRIGEAAAVRCFGQVVAGKPELVTAAVRVRVLRKGTPFAR